MEIRLAKEADIPRVMDFIKKYWSENHILANQAEFMKYQHMGRNGELTYVIAEENDEIYGIGGYIPMNGEERPDISGAMWKVIPSNYFMLGKAVREAVMKLSNCRYMSTPGVNIKTAGKVLGKYGQIIDKMSQYYRLADVKEYKIAKIKEKKADSSWQANTKGRLEKVADFKDMDSYLSEEYLSTKVPYKDLEYIRHRYFEHPVYHYDIYAIVQGEERSFVILREIAANESKMAKIVDFIGEDIHLVGISELWDSLMEEKGYEFLDFYCYGIADDILEQSGFTKRKEDDENIIPNYFEPFEGKVNSKCEKIIKNFIEAP